MDADPSTGNGDMTLQEILKQVAEGTLSVADAERLIRQGPPRPPQRGKARLIGFIFLCVGIVVAAVGIYLAYDAWTFAAAARTAEGTVVALIQTPGKRGPTSAPVVRYEVAGVAHEFQSSVSSSPPAYAVGEKVTVLFQPDNPADARIQSFVSQWLFPTAFTGFGVVFTVVGLVVLRTGATHWSYAKTVGN